MKSPLRRLVPAALGLALTTLVPVATASAATSSPTVFVQNDNPSGNTVFAYDRAADGTLTLAGSYPTGGLGGVLSGSVVDHLASQGALTLDRAHSLLFAVNAGSDTVSVFGVDRDRLSPLQTLPSGGSFPVSVAVSGNLAYVLNARGGGSVQGLRIDHQHVQQIAGSSRPLGLDATATPEFTHTPGQVTFTPDGGKLLVTTKANGNDVDVFSVLPSGRLGGATVNPLPGAVPFAGAFDPAGRLLLTEAGTNSVASFAVEADGTLTALGAVATNQAATCWITAIGAHAYASNAGSGSLTDLLAAPDGTLSTVGQTATDHGTVDATASADQKFLYVQTGAAGIVDEYQVQTDGTLVQVGAVTVPEAVGAEGIAAS